MFRIFNDPTPKVIEGRVRWYNSQAGFGYATCNYNGEDVVIYSKDVEQSGLRSLHADQIITFEISDKSVQAHAVHIKAA